VIELYAIADAGGPPVPEGGELHAVAVGGLAALYGPADDDEVSEATLWRREEVVEALMQDRDLLPVRYGTRLADEQTLARAIGERRQQLAAALERVRGAVELSLRVVPSERPERLSVADTGAEYLQARARAEEARAGARSALHEPLARLARDSVLRVPREPSELMRAAYLVDRPAVDEFSSLVGKLQEANSGFSLLCTGPWPPYSFADR
jgi:gas vesicle protein GvpL/GvpF